VEEAGGIASRGSKVVLFEKKEGAMGHKRYHYDRHGNYSGYSSDTPPLGLGGLAILGLLLLFLLRGC
jgi:hypothetical protein